MTAQVIHFPEIKNAQEIRRSISRLFASGIDGILPFSNLLDHCRNRACVIPEHEKTVLQQYGLVESDGSVTEEIRKIVLSETREW